MVADLTGTWHPVVVEGYEEMLKTIGFGGLKLKGGLIADEVIKQTETEIQIATGVTIMFIFLSKTQTIKINGTVDETDPLGNTWKVTAKWDGDELDIVAECAEKGFRNAGRRSIEDGDMVVKYVFTHPNGTINAIRRLKKKA